MLIHIALGDFLILLIILFIIGIFLGFYLTVEKNKILWEKLGD